MGGITDWIPNTKEYIIEYDKMTCLETANIDEIVYAMLVKNIDSKRYNAKTIIYINKNEFFQENAHEGSTPAKNNEVVVLMFLPKGYKDRVGLEKLFQHYFDRRWLTCGEQIYAIMSSLIPG